MTNISCKVKEWGNKSYRCFFELTLSVIGGKWKLIIIYHLSLNGTMRFSELRRGLPDITERMLVKQLRELEHDGIVHRQVFTTVPPRVDYSLTDTGRKLLPVLHQLSHWGEEYEKEMAGTVFDPALGYERP